jgi:hypothetical protein
VWHTLKKFIFGLMYENSEPSLTRVISTIAFLAFLAGSAFLLIKGLHWDHYETFATATAGGGLGGQLVNKFMNLSKGSPVNEPFIKNQGGDNNGK